MLSRPVAEQQDANKDEPGIQESESGCFPPLKTADSSLNSSRAGLVRPSLSHAHRKRHSQFLS